MTDLRKALAQPEQEPVEKNMTLACPQYLHGYTAPPKQPVKSYCGGKPNYCTPEVTPDVDGVNMSQERVDETAKCKHELDEPDIAVVDESGEGSNTMSWMLNLPLPVGTRLYTAPPKREWVGLTDEEIKSARDFVGFENELSEELHYFARHLETKLKGKNT